MKSYSYVIQVQRTDGTWSSGFGESPTEGHASDLDSWYRKDGTIKAREVSRIVKIEKQGPKYRWH